MSVLEAGNSTTTSRARMRPNRQSVKSAGLNEPGSSSHRIPIVDLKDDDEDVQVLSPRSIPQVRTSRRTRDQVFNPDLELRLGINGASLTSPPIAPAQARSTRGSKIATIDLTSGNDDDVIHIASKKRKAVHPSPEPSKDFHLTCAICMDTMKEETSTVCGHIFCRPCILGAIKAQKKCPSCRRKLTNSSIHRIYLSSSSR